VVNPKDEFNSVIIIIIIRGTCMLIDVAISGGRNVIKKNLAITVILTVTKN
jgi:hypothetical protein